MKRMATPGRDGMLGAVAAAQGEAERDVERSHGSEPPGTGLVTAPRRQLRDGEQEHQAARDHAREAELERRGLWLAEDRFHVAIVRFVGVKKRYGDVRRGI